MQDLQKSIDQLVDYIKGVWVKKRYVIISTWLICPLGFFYVASLPDVYSSEARVFVDTRSVLQPLLKGLAIQTNPEQEVQMMVKTLLSRENLEAIARDSDLDISTKNAAEYENLIKSLSSEINLRSAGRDNLFTISYAHKNPQMAKTVVQKTLDLFVEGTRGNSRQDSESASQFIDEQISEYETRLNEADQRLADFKRKYADILPNQGSFYQNFNMLETNLEQTKLTIRETEQQMKTLTDQIKGNKPQSDSFAVRESNSNVTLTTRFDSRIEALEGKLDELMLRYTELHPDVIETTDLLNNLKDQRTKELEEYYANRGDDESTDLVGSISSELRLEANRLQSLIASLKVRQADYESKIEVLKQKIDLVPQIEAESTALNRNYGTTKSKYEELLSRKESAELAQKADISSDDVKFRVLTPPLAPTKPSGPNRLIGYTLVLLLGFGSGLGIAFLISQINPILIRGSQLTSLTSYPVLGSVSHLNLVQIEKTNRNRLIVFIISSGLIFSFYVALVGADIMSINLYTRFIA
ncbi:MAG: Wzz/FepE/Etk N-terminal domain-containing protein [Paraglaciecola sp.]|uniref:XrtA system polysaccharide chain length determinant n=1 Tax=Paraglaciecola sp. TaxID=1920173 RepID=UPI00273D6B21|nr:XrtA system polysaccharide chain length determinant [Paraglaciecola sp.]MDP5029783.1 Wzz/FepE/Etk N-terminal domain-containing protein [Paraglaciecola sp.]MDP5131524.1 Wzz/FepE/Etk N-terminal domain-containing protein [Paraglaciecola sp.]